MSWPMTIGGPADQPGERRAEVAHHVGVELFADDAADVVGLDDAGQVTHAALPSRS